MHFKSEPYVHGLKDMYYCCYFKMTLVPCQWKFVKFFDVAMNFLSRRRCRLSVQ